MSTLTKLQAWKTDVDALIVSLSTMSTSASAAVAAAGLAERAVMVRRANHILHLIKVQRALSRWLAGGVAAAQASGTHPALTAAVPTSSVEAPGMTTIPTRPSRGMSV